MKKQLVFVYTRINGIEKRMVNTNLMPKVKVIESASELDPGDSVSAHVGKAVVRITQTEEVKR